MPAGDTQQGRLFLVLLPHLRLQRHSSSSPGKCPACAALAQEAECGAPSSVRSPRQRTVNRGEHLPFGLTLSSCRSQRLCV